MLRAKCNNDDLAKLFELEDSLVAAVATAALARLCREA